jgi:RNA polymerase sigma-70 factor (ECF subfamily)
MKHRSPIEEELVSASVRADDTELWSQLMARDPEAVGLLFDRHSRAVYNFAFRRTASWSAAEEVVQATFTTVWRKAAARSLPALDHRSALPWLLGVAHHESRNSARTQGRVQRRQARAAAPVPVGDHADEVAARVDDERRMSVVRRALSQLPTHERITIELVVWSGLTLAEAADLLHVAEGTVKSRLSRGRARLSILLDPSARDKEN